MKKSWPLLIGLVVVTEVVGFISGMLAGDSRGIYESFNQIPFAPPGSTFGIVWPILYAVMALSLYLAVTNVIKKQEVLTVIGLYGLQLGLNFFWSIIFFGGDQLFLGALIIIALLVVVFFQFRFYYRIKPVAGLLLIPYWLWLAFALYLNIGFALVN